jgi:hypothetical protein
MDPGGLSWRETAEVARGRQRSPSRLAIRRRFLVGYALGEDGT